MGAPKNDFAIEDHSAAREQITLTNAQAEGLPCSPVCPRLSSAKDAPDPSPPLVKPRLEEVLASRAPSENSGRAVAISMVTSIQLTA